MNYAQLAACEPVYIEMQGWQTPTDQIRDWSLMPERAKNYLTKICELSGAKLSIASVGPNREQTILL
jgi:adenylosuccinate synthase